jgi:hypothetical protein
MTTKTEHFRINVPAILRKCLRRKEKRNEPTPNNSIYQFLKKSIGNFTFSFHTAFRGLAAFHNTVTNRFP